MVEQYTQNKYFMKSTVCDKHLINLKNDRTVRLTELFIVGNVQWIGLTIKKQEQLEEEE